MNLRKGSKSWAFCPYITLESVSYQTSNWTPDTSQ